MSFDERRRRNGPVFKTHEKAHRAVLAAENWFGNRPPAIGKQFTAAKAKERKVEIIDLLFRAANCERRGDGAGVADRLEVLADKLHHCCPRRRCGSLVCPECLRAFQKAKVAAQRTTINLLKVTRNRKLLVMANIIPLWIAFTTG